MLLSLKVVRLSSQVYTDTLLSDPAATPPPLPGPARHCPPCYPFPLTPKSATPSSIQIYPPCYHQSRDIPGATLPSYRPRLPMHLSLNIATGSVPLSVRQGACRPRGAWTCSQRASWTLRFFSARMPGLRATGAVVALEAGGSGVGSDRRHRGVTLVRRGGVPRKQHPKQVGGPRHHECCPALPVQLPRQ